MKLFNKLFQVIQIICYTLKSLVDLLQKKCQKKGKIDENS